MTSEQIYRAIEEYRELFIQRGIGKIVYSHDELLVDLFHGLEHCHGMLDQMIEFMEQGRVDKVFRWLGFIQGVVWSARLYTLTDLKNHNRPF